MLRIYYFTLPLRTETPSRFTDKISGTQILLIPVYNLFKTWYRQGGV